MVKHLKKMDLLVIYDEAVYLQEHLSVLVEDGNVKHQPSQEMLQHGGPEVPGHTVTESRTSELYLDHPGD